MNSISVFGCCTISASLWVADLEATRRTGRKGMVMRADTIEDSFLQAIASATENGESVPLQLHHLHGRGFTDGLGAVLSDEVHPGWPDRVQAFREWEVPLDEMWTGLARSGWEVFVTIAHASCVAQTAGEPDPMTGEFASHPAVTLYLRGPWCCLLEISHAFRPVSSASAHAKMEARAFSEAVDALIGMWGKLGLSFSLNEDGSTYIAVTEPQRA